ncbi:NAD(FAD)-utilizing dehydrogenase [Granulibacter bethesdensis]|uniref:NAD(FAD)-utilizing dehydrogenase n=2 Tax=Granulibacter bethesdensis TaxID=364410 RepID=Q0BU17_GRABC|nr:NAD(FAD)-utilizing dehydrogenase [Granulibacter bethesdensis CGDNIH1]AHJ69497.1 NAD(FAD)-utilizing dehydrogenase [Granulibacter bethesdensis]APH51491.1 NAD(FAD)-utilizing dehydrogenase [Granulibacter bethesdensis]APH64184.1 NAD(FAD)-utilizing dehydrogenase [Granulibacter bethesdensis]
MSATACPPMSGIAIIGAGPAGLCAAEHLSALGHTVHVYEKMPSPARRLLMAGRGGLNLTHSEPLADFLTRYGSACPSLEAALCAFPPDALRHWAEGLGQPLFVGSSGRVFPRAMKASPLLRAWLERLTAQGVIIHTRHEWRGWQPDGSLLISGPDGAPHQLPPVAATLLALGGASWPRLGSNGDWVTSLTKAGLPVAPLKPANCGFSKPWTPFFISRHEGTALKNIALSIAGEPDQTARGDLIITAYGLEGGPIYALSARLRDLIERNGHADLCLDLRPDMAKDIMAAKLARARSRESLSNTLRKALTLSSAASHLLRESTVSPPADPGCLAALIKSLPLRLTGVQPLERAISTAGGVRWEAVDEQFMIRSRPGLFVAGEMLDWEAPTGGYLLQACFATGRAAASGMAHWLEKQSSL